MAVRRPGIPSLSPTRRREGIVEYDLTIDRTRIDFGGRPGRAVTLNGSVPGPLLRFTEGDEVIIRVQNMLDEDTSIHWHGLLVPNEMDGVPLVNFPGIRSDTTFEYRFPLQQYGTYWYHSHSFFQEQLGHYGPLIIDPAGEEPYGFDREHIIVVSDWTFEDPHDVLNNLRARPDYYDFQRPTLVEQLGGEGMSLGDRLQWQRMRMDPADISDITGATYTFLMNGQAPEPGWFGQFEPGERVRFRFINAAAGTFYDVRIPGLPMTVIQADGQHVEPVEVDEFRIAIAETFDVVVEPEDRAYTVVAEAIDRSGYARGTIAPRAGMEAPVPEQRERPLLTMMDMGMAHDEHGSGDGEMHEGMQHEEMDEPVEHDHGEGTGLRPPGTLPEPVEHGPDGHGPGNAMVPDITRSRLHEPGIGLDDVEHRVLVYTDLRALEPEFRQPPDREIELHLTGNMERYMWSINGNTYAEEPQFDLTLGERVRLTMVNDTMMNHPMHLHGMWMELENGQGEYIPRVHTINVKPAERLSVLISVDALGPWAFHCHILYHMELGMFRVAMVRRPGEGD